MTGIDNGYIPVDSSSVRLTYNSIEASLRTNNISNSSDVCLVQNKNT